MPRKKSGAGLCIPGRKAYKDFQTWLAEYGDSDVVKMDAVLGLRISRKTMLTMLF